MLPELEELDLDYKNRRDYTRSDSSVPVKLHLTPKQLMDLIRIEDLNLLDFKWDDDNRLKIENCLIDAIKRKQFEEGNRADLL